MACGSMVFSGIFSWAAVVAPMGVPSATLAIMGRFAVNISYNIGLQYAAELLPTVVRAQGVALIHIMGYVGSLLAPFIVYMVSPLLYCIKKSLGPSIVDCFLDLSAEELWLLMLILKHYVSCTHYNIM